MPYIRMHSVLFTTYNTGEQNGYEQLKVIIEDVNEWFIVIFSRCRRNQQFDDLSLLFCGITQRHARNTSICPLLSNNILALLRIRCCSCRLCFNSLLSNSERRSFLSLNSCSSMGRASEQRVENLQCNTLHDP